MVRPISRWPLAYFIKQLSKSVESSGGRGHVVAPMCNNQVLGHVTLVASKLFMGLKLVLANLVQWFCYDGYAIMSLPGQDCQTHNQTGECNVLSIYFTTNV